MGQFRKPEKHLAILITLHVVICCISLVAIAAGAPGPLIDANVYHIHFRIEGIWIATLGVGLFAVVGGGLFVLCPFSIAYFIGFYLFSATTCFLWLNSFSDFPYNHLLAGWSGAISCVAFLLPALLMCRPFKRIPELPVIIFDRAVCIALFVIAIVIAAGAFYNFSVPLAGRLNDARETIVTPKIIGYLLWTSSSALLPFAFAYTLGRRWYGRLCIVVLLQLLLFPITLTKTALFAPLWLTFVHLLSAKTPPRNVVVLSLFLPMSFGLILLALNSPFVALPFSIVNFRMIAIPALAMDIYNDFFSRHELTHFCQISLLKTLFSCPYSEQLSVVMQREYHLGYFNASLFATEGVASVGLWFAPLIAFLAGIIVSFANRASAHLSPHFTLVSAGMLPQVFLNVPLSVAAITHGVPLLCLLWYLTPRGLFVPFGNLEAAGHDAGAARSGTGAPFPNN